MTHPHYWFEGAKDKQLFAKIIVDVSKTKVWTI